MTVKYKLFLTAADIVSALNNISQFKKIMLHIILYYIIHENGNTTVEVPKAA